MKLIWTFSERKDIGLGKNRSYCGFFVEPGLTLYSFLLSSSLSSKSFITLPNSFIRSFKRQNSNRESRFVVYDERFGVIPHKEASIRTKCSRSRIPLLPGSRHPSPSPSRLRRRWFPPPPPPLQRAPPPSHGNHPIFPFTSVSSIRFVSIYISFC